MRAKLILFSLAATLLGARAASAQTNLWSATEHCLARWSGTNIVWQINADPAEGKPYFHPLATPGGTLLTALRPKDHVWHRGLWWSWKLINGLNYWEENPQTGRSEGQTELLASRQQPRPDGGADLQFELAYHPWGEPPLLTERREIHVSTPTNGSYEIAWTAAFTAVTNVVLGRKPLAGEPDGATWGGYAGLSLRLDAARRNWIFSNDQNRTGEKQLHGQPAAWVKFSAGSNAPAVTIFDDARNPRHPTPWYVNQQMPYLNPAFLYRQELKLAAGEKLVLHYRIVITDHDQTQTKETK